MILSVGGFEYDPSGATWEYNNLLEYPEQYPRVYWPERISLAYGCEESWRDPAANIHCPSQNIQILDRYPLHLYLPVKKLNTSIFYELVVMNI